MSIELYEMARQGFGTGKSGSAKIMWFARGSDDRDAVRAQAEISIPAFEQDMPRVGLDFQGLGAGVWHVGANYSTGEQSAPGGGGGGGGGSDTNENDPIGAHVRVSFGTRTQHVTQSLYTVINVNKKTDPRNPPDHKGAIGVTTTSVDGCDIQVPNLTWSETWTFNPRFVTWAFIKTLRDLEGRVNNDKFRSFRRGEVMFLGGEESQDDPKKATIVFNFFAEETVVNLVLATDFNPIPFKEGHQYVWAEYEREVSNKNPIIPPFAAHLEEVGRPGGDDENGHPTNKADFTLLRIGR